MAYTISKVGVRVGRIKDRPGGLAEKLVALAKARANLEFVIARRDKPGIGLLFVAPLRSAAQARAGARAGLKTARGLHSLRLVGTDRPGLGAKIATALASARINLRGLSAASLSGKCIVYFAFDSAADANKAARVLRNTLR